MFERARRLDADEQRALAAEARRAPAVLLDEPDPMPEMFEEDQEFEPPYDPSWDLETRWSQEPAPTTKPSRPPGPGLARTQPEDANEKREERSA
ncbi:MAG: hypothetical protein QM820_07860 [Minicystis sp.]